MYKEEFSTIIGTYSNGITRVIDFEENGKKYRATCDMTKPVTLQRMHELKAKLKDKTGIDFNYLEIDHSVYLFDCDEETYKEYHQDIPLYDKPIDKTYQFWADQNRLLIWDRGYPVYENNNGVICKDETALADCLC
jgi:hypothetical protein